MVRKEEVLHRTKRLWLSGLQSETSEEEREEWKVKDFLIQSGPMCEVVRAKNPISAAKKAIRKAKPASLGVVIQCDEINTDLTMFVSTTQIVKVRRANGN